MTQMVAAEIELRIALVFDPGQATSARPGLDGRARTVEQGAQAPRTGSARRIDCPHRRCAAHTTAAQQAKQQGFRLIVLMMTEDQPVARDAIERGVALISRRGFKSIVCVARNRHLEQGKRHFKLRTARGAGLGPGIGMRAQTMVHMRGLQGKAEAWRQGVQHIEHNDRVHPARQGATQACPRADARGRQRASGDLQQHVRPPLP